MQANRLQLTLPFLGTEQVRFAAPNALVEVVLDPKEGRARVRPVDFEGWVRFPVALRIPGKFYRVELLKPIRGGAWAATGSIQPVKSR